MLETDLLATLANRKRLPIITAPSLNFAWPHVDLCIVKDTRKVFNDTVPMVAIRVHCINEVTKLPYVKEYAIIGTPILSTEKIMSMKMKGLGDFTLVSCIDFKGDSVSQLVVSFASKDYKFKAASFSLFTDLVSSNYYFDENDPNVKLLHIVGVPSVLEHDDFVGICYNPASHSIASLEDTIDSPVFDDTCCYPLIIYKDTDSDKVKAVFTTQDGVDYYIDSGYGDFTITAVTGEVINFDLVLRNTTDGSIDKYLTFNPSLVNEDLLWVNIESALTANDMELPHNYKTCTLLEYGESEVDVVVSHLYSLYEYPPIPKSNDEVKDLLALTADKLVQMVWAKVRG